MRDRLSGNFRAVWRHHEVCLAARRAAGSPAGLILVDADSSCNIAEVENVSFAIKVGKVYEPARIEQAILLRHRQPESIDNE
jgi:hypothetical protein